MNGTLSGCLWPTRSVAREQLVAAAAGARQGSSHRTQAAARFARRRRARRCRLLDVRADDRVLEIGAGAGLAIEELARLAAEGYVCGIDHSELMLRRAKRHNAEGLGRGVVDLRLGSVEDLPAFDEPFDKILAVNAMMFGRVRACGPFEQAGDGRVELERIGLTQSGQLTYLRFAIATTGPGK